MPKPAPNLVQITPFLHVPDLEKAIAFFTNILGFTVTFRHTDYAFIRRERAAFRLIACGPGDPPRAFTPRVAHYIDVRDLATLHAELAPKLATLAPDQVYGPVYQEYGQRELMVVGPDGDLIVFGQAIA
jgi:catechol 2,3-dioxygenase-like lactoylglutathione lyase family enzyme